MACPPLPVIPVTAGPLTASIRPGDRHLERVVDILDEGGEAGDLQDSCEGGWQTRLGSENASVEPARHALRDANLKEVLHHRLVFEYVPRRGVEHPKILDRVGLASL